MSRSLPIATQTASNYKANIDAMAAWNFGVYPQSTPDMTVNVAAGALNVDGVIVSQSIQATGTITAPSTNPRIDRVVIDRRTGTASVITGTEAASPSAPSVPVDKISCAQIALATSTTSIDDTLITNEFPVVHGNPIYITASLSPTGDPTKDFGRICRITLNALFDKATVRFRANYDAEGNYAEYLIIARQAAALNNDPVCHIECVDFNNKRATGATFTTDVLNIANVRSFYTISATESYIDVYLSSLNNNDIPFVYQFTFVQLYATAQFEAFNEETPIAALSWDDTSQAATGLVVYDSSITLENGFGDATARLKAVRGNGGYWVSLSKDDAISHSSASSLSTSPSAPIPSDYRPTGTVANTYASISSAMRTVSVTSSGLVVVNYYNSTTGAATSLTTTGYGFSISWFVSD